MGKKVDVREKGREKEDLGHCSSSSLSLSLESAEKACKKHVKDSHQKHNATCGMRHSGREGRAREVPWLHKNIIYLHNFFSQLPTMKFIVLSSIHLVSLLALADAAADVAQASFSLRGNDLRLQYNWKDPDCYRQCKMDYGDNDSSDPICEGFCREPDEKSHGETVEQAHAGVHDPDDSGENMETHTNHANKENDSADALSFF